MVLFKKQLYTDHHRLLQAPKDDGHSRNHSDTMRPYNQELEQLLRENKIHYKGTIPTFASTAHKINNAKVCPMSFAFIHHCA